MAGLILPVTSIRTADKVPFLLLRIDTFGHPFEVIDNKICTICLE